MFNTATRDSENGNNYLPKIRNIVALVCAEYRKSCVNRHIIQVFQILLQ